MYLKLTIYCIYIVIVVICWSLSVASVQDDFNSERAKQLIKFSKTADIKAFINYEIDPCEDFYSYTCGNWHTINPAQYSNNIITDKFQIFTKGIEKRLKKSLIKEKNGGIEDKVKDFYNSCLNAKVDSAKYSESLLKIYREFGEFSAFQTEEPLKENNFKWWSTVAKIQHKYGKSIILSLNILDDIKTKSKTMACLGQPDFELTQEALNMMHTLQQNRISKYLQLYLNMSNEDASITAQNAIIFENNLSQGGTDIRENKQIEEQLILYNTTELFEKYQDLFNVKEYLEIVLGTKDLPEQIYVYDESYLVGLYDVTNTIEKELVQDYILSVFLDEFLIDNYSGDIKQECIDKSRKYFGKFIDHAMYNQYRSNESEAGIYELWDDIKSTFRDQLQTEYYHWMSNATRQEAIKKLNNMKLTINSYDNDNFIEIFKNLEIDLSDYVLNVQNILEHAESLRENKLEKKTEEDSQVLSFTPVYNILNNQIKIPVSLLQLRFIWDPIYPKAIQYSTLGYLIAHEMIHGFDDQGRYYDANGKSFNWWDEKSAKEFESRRKCFVDQYHNYTYHGNRLTESDQQSENIADNGGLNIAYNSYRRWLNKRKQTETNVERTDTLPRLPFNNRELFFISFAQLWCEDILPKFRSSLANGDIHAPGKYRVIGPLSNSREFSWIFKCNTKKCNMDAPKKCKIY